MHCSHPKCKMDIKLPCLKFRRPISAPNGGGGDKVIREATRTEEINTIKKCQSSIRILIFKSRAKWHDNTSNWNYEMMSILFWAMRLSLSEWLNALRSRNVELESLKDECLNCGKLADSNIRMFRHLPTNKRVKLEALSLILKCFLLLWPKKLIN